MSRPNHGPRLDRNERGVYEIRWTEAGRSKRRSTRTADLPSAQKVFANFLMLDERERMIEAAANDGDALVMEVIGDHNSGWMPGAGPRPRDYWHEHILEKAVDKERPRYAFDKLHAHFGHLAVKDITPDDVQAYVDRRSKRPQRQWCPAAQLAGPLGRPSVNHTISTELSVLNAAINHAVRKKRVPKAEQPFIQLPGTSPPRDRWLTPEEAGRLVDAAREEVNPHQPKGTLPRVFRFVLLALGTASRKSALLEAKRAQVQLEGNLIELNPAGRAQTNKRRPRVPISDWLRPYIDDIMAQIPDDPEAYLLDHAGSIRTAFENAVSRAGLGREVTPHVLRHTKATWMAQAGVSMFDIAGVLGDSVETVTKTYAHHHPDYLRGAINAGMPKLGARA